MKSVPGFAQRAGSQGAEVLSPLVFLFSSTTQNPERFFQGYFFHGTDYVTGEEGFERFREARGVERPEREDGCYVLAERENSGYYRFSTDYAGYKKLFYFWDDGFWVVSNSLYRIAEHLRRHGYPVLPDHSQLAAMATEGTFYRSGRGSFFAQLTSFDTLVRGVRLVPADYALRIGSSGYRLEKAPRLPRQGNYRDRLERFINTWIGRLSTLAREPAVRISCDLTGGLDSRTVFSLLLGALRDCDRDVANRLQICCGGGRGTGKDHLIASLLCRRFSMPLNGPLGRKQAWLNGKTSYALWKDLCLGVYHPILFPGAFPTGEIIRLGGAGGENHRPFYAQFLGAPSAETFVARRTRNIRPASARRGFEAALQQAIGRVTEDAPEYLDILACHYRHSRNRFHAGREPQYTVKFLPLASKLLDDVTAVAGKARFHAAQVHYDILYNLSPELLDLPFDRGHKRPGRGVRRNFTAITILPATPGTCFIGEVRAPRQATRKGKKTASAIAFLREEFDVARNGFAADFLGHWYVRRAAAALERAVHDGGFSSPVQSKRVAAIIACTMFEP